jgi:ribosomal RNA assembly protein
MTTFLAVPKDRVAILVGTEGKTKRWIESRCGIDLDISSDGQVTIHDEKSKDALLAYRAREVVKAIGRGFAPDKALELLDDGISFFLLDLAEHARNDKSLKRLRARVIGAGGKCRRVFEDTLGIYMSVYGDTVGVIGPDEAVAIARDGIERLLGGAMHATVYKLIEKKKRDNESVGIWQ